MNDYAKVIHAGGKKMIHHACGRLQGLLPLIAQERVDCMESITPPSTGDVTPAECFEAWGDRFLVIGGIDPLYLRECTAEQLEEHMTNTVEAIPPAYRGRFILQNGDSVPPDVPLERLAQICRFGERYPF